MHFISFKLIALYYQLTDEEKTNQKQADTP